MYINFCALQAFHIPHSTEAQILPQSTEHECDVHVYYSTYMYMYITIHWLVYTTNLANEVKYQIYISLPLPVATYIHACITRVKLHS